MSKKSPTISMHLSDNPIFWEIYFAKIIIDGKEIGKVTSNKTVIFQLQSGEHTFLAENSYYKSDKIVFKLAENDNFAFNIFLLLPFEQQMFFPLSFLSCPNKKVDGAVLCIERMKDTVPLEPNLPYKSLSESHADEIDLTADIELGYDENGNRIGKNS